MQGLSAGLRGRVRHVAVLRHRRRIWSRAGRRGPHHVVRHPPKRFSALCSEPRR
ncbi:hypothetical protein FM103_16680 [Corynebacterium xerosis]|nr:hypothetical protein FM103_16680 [Corynebacterium xerosis]